MAHLLFNGFLFLIGVGLLVYSVEELIEQLSKAAVLTGISSFFLAVVLVGMDFENWAFGVASILRDLPGVALGSAFGSAIFLVGVALAIGGLITPFEVNSDGDYLLLMLLSPLFLLPLAWDGVLSRSDGSALLIVFVALIYYMYWQESKGREIFRDREAEEAIEEVEGSTGSPWRHLGMSILFVLGIVAGSELAVRGIKNLVSLLNLNQTVFGMTVVGLVMSLEEVLLVVEPVRQGREGIAVGNVIGSMIFFSTGNVALIALTRGFSTDPSILNFYWPFLFASTVLVAVFLYNGRIKRIEAGVLMGMYIIYWILSYLVI